MHGCATSFHTDSRVCLPAESGRHILLTGPCDVAALSRSIFVHPLPRCARKNGASRAEPPGFAACGGEEARLGGVSAAIRCSNPAEGSGPSLPVFGEGGYSLRSVECSCAGGNPEGPIPAGFHPARFFMAALLEGFRTGDRQPVGWRRFPLRRCHRHRSLSGAIGAG